MGDPAKILTKIQHFQAELKKVEGNTDGFEALYEEIIMFFRAIELKMEDYEDITEYPFTGKLWFENDNAASLKRLGLLKKAIMKLLQELEQEYSMRVDIQ